MEFEKQFREWTEEINKALDFFIQEKNTPENTIYKAMRYSIMSGGKRIRPVLMMAVCELLEGNYSDVIPFACSLEMIHTYSLIHDDLPAMDNDDYRRGRLTNHKVFGEAIAVLAGDALLNSAFEIMIGEVNQECKRIKESVQKDAFEKLFNKTKAAKIIVESSGVSGMIGGQVVDIESEGEKASKDILNYLHSCKTGAIIKSSVVSSAFICGADEEQIACLENYSKCLGLAFQIKDDILDFEGDPEIMGKSSGKDLESGKSTFVTIYGLEEAKRKLESITQEAIESLEIFQSRADFLRQMALYLLKRQK